MANEPMSITLCNSANCLAFGVSKFASIGALNKPLIATPVGAYMPRHMNSFVYVF